MGWEHYQTVDPLKKERQVGRGLFGVRLLILHFKFQFSKSIKSSTFPIFLNLTYPLRKNISFPKCPKITAPKIYTKTAKHWFMFYWNRGIWRCLKRARDSGTKAMLSDVKTVFKYAYFKHFNFPFVSVKHLINQGRNFIILCNQAGIKTLTIDQRRKHCIQVGLFLITCNYSPF